MRKWRAVVFAGAFVVVVLVGVIIAALWPDKPPPTILPVEGVILLEGQPLKRASVRFIPQGNYGPDYIAFGVTDEAGRYKLYCNDQPGACAGENQVLILETPPPFVPKDPKGHPQTSRYYESLGGRPLPKKYANAASSPLTAEVRADRTRYDFELTR
jgi:hypothetical protein